MSYGRSACPPLIVGVGIGGTLEKTAVWRKKRCCVSGPTHRFVLCSIRNCSSVSTIWYGPQGFGAVTALAVHIETYAAHIANACSCEHQLSCCIQAEFYRRGRENQVKVKHLLTPLTEADILALQAGQAVLISGIIYTARDAAHKKLAELQQSGQPLPFALHGQLLYYVGPSPARPGQVIGAAGPTTSSRMDRYTPLLAQGLKSCMGKVHTSGCQDALVRYKAVYLAAVGVPALYPTVRQAEVVAYPELGPEAVYRLQVENFPAVVVNDAYGQDL